MCISVPIKIYTFPVAIDIAGPEARMKPKMNEFITQLKAAAYQIEQNLARMLK
jgi:DNA-binding IclR family transcriptional regulator